MTEPKWLELARQDLGVAEIAGPRANPRIMTYYRAAHADWAKDDSVPWCGAAMAAWVSLAGFPVPAEAARARAWLDWGTPLEAPRTGCVTVFQRGSDPASGHVALYLADRGDRIDVLGGNQGDAVSITAFPKRSVIGYRWPPTADLAPVPDKAAPVVVVPDKPLTRSKTVWGGGTAGLAVVGSYFDGGIRLGLEWAASLASLAPLKSALIETGANARALTLGLGVSAVMAVITARARAKAEGRSA